MLSLKGKIALVTGASRGIGQAVALQLAKQGATVIGTGTNEAGVADVEAALSPLGGRGVQLDVTCAEQVEAVLADLAKEGGPHILVNNAGITRDGLAMRMKDEDWDAVIQTNLNSVFRMCRGVLRPMMKARSGRIINITSVVASMGNPGQVNYCAAKGGVLGMSKSLSMEVASRGITVNCVAPGFIATAMTDALNEEQKAAIAARIPMGSLGQAQDVANAVAFLVSDEARYITGTTLHVNGGLYLA